MKCPICNENTKVIDTLHPDDESVRRRRECLNPECKHRFFTVEYEEIPYHDPNA